MAMEAIRGSRTAVSSAADGHTITVSAEEWTAMQEAKQKFAELKKLLA
jgi:hypothetical protein